MIATAFENFHCNFGYGRPESLAFNPRQKHTRKWVNFIRKMSQFLIWVQINCLLLLNRRQQQLAVLNTCNSAYLFAIDRVRLLIRTNAIITLCFFYELSRRIAFDFRITLSRNGINSSSRHFLIQDTPHTRTHMQCFSFTSNVIGCGLWLIQKRNRNYYEDMEPNTQKRIGNFFRVSIQHVSMWLLLREFHFHPLRRVLLLIQRINQYVLTKYMQWLTIEINPISVDFTILFALLPQLTEWSA